MLKVILITALVGAVWTKGYPYEQTKIDDDDHGLINEDEVRPQYKQPAYQAQVQYNDGQDLIAEDEPEDIYQQKSVEAYSKQAPSYGGKLRPEGKQGNYKGSEIKHKKNSYESTKVSQEEYEIKSVSSDFGARLPSYNKKEAPKAYKTPEIPSTKGIYKKTSEEVYSGIGQKNIDSGIQESYKPKPSYKAPAQEQVEVELKYPSYKGGKGKSNDGYAPKHSIVDDGLRPGHYGSQGVYMGHSVYKPKDVSSYSGYDTKQKSISYQKPQTHGIYREGGKQDSSSASHGSDSYNQGYGSTQYHKGQSNSGSYQHAGLDSSKHRQEQYGKSGYADQHKISYGGSGSDYSGIGASNDNTHQSSKTNYDSHGSHSGAHLQSGSGYKNSHDASYKSSANLGSNSNAGYGHSAGSLQKSYQNAHSGQKSSGIKTAGYSGYGASSGSHLQSGSDYKRGYEASQNGYKSSGVKSVGSSGYGIDSGSHLQSGSGYKSGYDASHNGYKSSGIKSTGSSGYGASSGSHLQAGSGYKGGYEASQNGYKSSGIKNTGSSGYGIGSGSHQQAGSGYKSGFDASHSGYKSSGVKSTGSSGYGIGSGSHLQSGSGYKGGYGASHGGYKSTGNQGIKTSGYKGSSGSHSLTGSGYKSGIEGQKQYHSSSHSGSGQYGSGIKTGLSHAKAASNYGSSNLEGSAYERGHQQNIGHSYHTQSNTYVPSSYHNNNNDRYSPKNIKSSAHSGFYGAIGQSSKSGIKSSPGYHGSNLGVSSYDKNHKKTESGSSTYYPKENYEQPKYTQQKHVDEYLESGKIDDGIRSTGYKGIGETYKGHPSSSKTSYPTYPKSSGSGIKGGYKTQKHPVEYKDKLEDKYQPQYGNSGAPSLPYEPSKGYSVKGSSGIKTHPSSYEVSSKKSPYQSASPSHASSGYGYPSIKGSSDKYEPKKLEQKDLSYEAILGSPGTSSVGAGSGGYGFTSGGSPNSGYSGPVYGSDDKYEMSKPMPYEFKYDIKDDKHGSDHYREEKMDDNGYLTGRYGYKDPHGLYREVEYQASKDGFKVSSIKTNEPGTENQDPADVHFEVEEGHQSHY